MNYGFVTPKIKMSTPVAIIAFGGSGICIYHLIDSAKEIVIRLIDSNRDLDVNYGDLSLLSTVPNRNQLPRSASENIIENKSATPVTY